MAVVDGVPGFTQIPRLNVTETLAINGIPSGKTVLFGTSFSSQVPTALDTPIQIEFGAAQNTSADPVQIDALGNLTVNRGGTYLISVLLSYQRTGAGGQSIAFIRFLVNGQQGDINTIAISEDDNDSTTPLQYSLVVNANEGDILSVEFYRDSGGVNQGSLVSFVSSIGWGQAPSAVVRIVKV